MLTLHEEITVPRSPEACFRYVADFRTTCEWDATAIRAEKTTPGAPQLGSRFTVWCKAGPGTIAIDYEIVELQPWHSVVLVGKSRFFDIRDTIVFTEVDDGTHISYAATFTWRFGLAHLARFGEGGLRKMGRNSLEGLRTALNDDNRTPAISRGAARADECVLPGVAMFSKWGYRRGLSHWVPMSSTMDDRHALVTGASAGLGLATAKALAAAGARLTLVIRNPDLAEATRDQIIAETGNEAIRFEFADLSLMGEVDALVERLIQRGEPLDVLINNAGALFNDYGLTAEGIERSAALLLLSPWRLTEGLKPLLAGHSYPARVINVVSGGMYSQRLSLKRLVMTADNYDGPTAYARAKRALTVLTEQWAENWQQDNIVVNAMHPGWADTPGVQGALPTFRSLTRRILRTPEEGADTIVWLARATEADKLTGKLFLDREPRTPYLLKKTREREEERLGLRSWLEAHLKKLTAA